MSARGVITDRQRRERLAVRHRLAPAARTNEIAAIADSLVALHSSDPATVYLSAMARMQQPSTEAVSAALYEQRSVVRHHAMRRTLWVFSPQNARAAHAACTTALAVYEWKRLAQMAQDSGLSQSGTRWVQTAKNDTLAALRHHGEMTARQLGAAVPALAEKLHLSVGKPYAGTQGAHTRVLLNLGFDGAIVRGRPKGSWINAEYTWSLTDEWLSGGLVGVAPDVGAADLVRAYLARFGPATLADVQWWMGWTLGLTKKSLAAVGAVEVALDDGIGWMLAEDLDSIDATASGANDASWISFLPGLDPTTMGWKQREWYLGDLGGLGATIFDRNGNGGPTVWLDGRVVGGWAQRKSGEVVYELLTNVPANRRKHIAAEAERISGMIGNERVSVRFPAPMQKTLLS